MKSGKAKTLDQAGLDILLAKIDETEEDALVLRVAFMLKYMAGLRVQEVAGLRWDTHIFAVPGKFHTREYPLTHDGKAVYDGYGNPILTVVKVIEIFDDISKYTGGRAIPLHEAMEQPLLDLWAENRSEFVIPQGKPGAARDIKHRAHALKMRINRLYTKYGMEGYSSHSGRRSMLTRSAQRVNLDGCSLEDTRSIAGHKSINTTRQYVDFSPRQAEHIRKIWD